MTIAIDFKWTRSLAYECTTIGSRRAITPVGKRRDRPFEPLKIDAEKPLYLQFANLDGSEDACLKFARAWGLLTTESQTASEFIDDWKQEIRDLGRLTSILQRSEGNSVDPSQTIKITTLDVSLRTAGRNNRRPALLLAPRNLSVAMHLQMAQSAAGGASIIACKQCSDWFERGASDSRRSIAIFCSEKCKNRFHYLERAKQ